MIKKIILREDQLEDLISGLPDFENEGGMTDEPCRCNDFSLIYNSNDCYVGCEGHGGPKEDDIMAPITGMGDVQYSYDPSEIASTNSSSSFGYTPLQERQNRRNINRYLNEQNSGTTVNCPSPCPKHCDELPIPQSWYDMVDVRNCNFVVNKMNFFQQKMDNMTDKCNCQYKRLGCKYNYLKARKISLGC